MTQRGRRKKLREIVYRPANVKDLLTEMKDTSELMLDLAYGAIIFDSTEMAQEVEREELRMDELLYQVRMQAMLAARSVEDAEQLSGILQIASAAETISNAAGDIVNLLGSKIEFRSFIPFIMKEADEKIKLVRITSGSDMDNRTIGDLKVENETGTRIIAIKRDKRWIYGPEGEQKLKAKDTLIVRGVEDGFKELAEYACGILKWGELSPGREPKTNANGKCYPVETRKKSRSSQTLKKIERLFLEMKDTSELMVDLAYTSLLFDNDDLAKVVYELEETIDEMFRSLQRGAVEKIAPISSDMSVGLIRLGGSIEMIADAASSIAEVVLRDIDPHPILKMSILESDAMIAKVRIGPRSNLVGKTLRSVRLASETGMWLVAIRRRKGWIIGPEPDAKLRSNDILFARGTQDGEELLKKMAKTR